MNYLRLQSSVLTVDTGKIWSSAICSIISKFKSTIVQVIPACIGSLWSKFSGTISNPRKLCTVYNKLENSTNVWRMLDLILILDKSRKPSSSYSLIFKKQ